MRIVAPLKLEVTWSDKVALPLVFARILAGAPASSPIHALARKEVFSSVAVEEWGHGLDWPASDGWSMDAERLRALAVGQAGMPTPSEFAAWMERNGLSLNTAANALGMTRRMITHYRTGSRLIPKVVWLACNGWEALHKQKKPPDSPKRPRGQPTSPCCRTLPRRARSRRIHRRC